MTESHVEPEVPALTVYFDGACPLCRREIGLYRNCQGGDRVDWVDVGTSGGAAPPVDLPREAALARFHVRRHDGTLISGMDAFSQLWLTLPGWRWLGRMVRLPGILPLAELIYRGFLKVRPALQRLVRRLDGPDRKA